MVLFSLFDPSFLVMHPFLFLERPEFFRTFLLRPFDPLPIFPSFSVSAADAFPPSSNTPDGIPLSAFCLRYSVFPSYEVARYDFNRRRSRRFYSDVSPFPLRFLPSYHPFSPPLTMLPLNPVSPFHIIALIPLHLELVHYFLRFFLSQPSLSPEFVNHASDPSPSLPDIGIHIGCVLFFFPCSRSPSVS